MHHYLYHSMIPCNKFVWYSCVGFLYKLADRTNRSISLCFRCQMLLKLRIVKVRAFGFDLRQITSESAPTKLWPLLVTQRQLTQACVGNFMSTGYCVIASTPGSCPVVNSPYLHKLSYRLLMWYYIARLPGATSAYMRKRRNFDVVEISMFDQLLNVGLSNKTNTV